MHWSVCKELNINHDIRVFKNVVFQADKDVLMPDMRRIAHDLNDFFLANIDLERKEDEASSEELLESTLKLSLQKKLWLCFKEE